MVAELTAVMTALAREAGGIGGAVVLGTDGSVLAHAWPDAQETPDALAGLCGALFAQVTHLAAEADLGSPRQLCLHGERGHLVIGRTTGGLIVGLTAGRAALSGQVQRHLEAVLSSLEQA
jgi:predicted regulator of Ras-like GTPase activity (Roadblock/LC7/MglB family)